MRRAALHDRDELGVDDEGRQGVDREDLGEFGRRHVLEFCGPRVRSSQIELLAEIGVCISKTAREGGVVPHVVAGRHA
jgi:hypothetical protein